MIRKLLCLSIVLSASLSTAYASDKMYIDDAELNCKHNTFRIHVGHNEWVKTHTIHRDETGLYTFENDLFRDLGVTSMGYEKEWKCPYCHQYWPIGKPCSNSSCPSRYR
jgi:hypothetical protein